MTSPRFWGNVLLLGTFVLCAPWVIKSCEERWRAERFVAQLGSPPGTGPRGEAVQSPAQKAAYEALVSMGNKAVPSLRGGLRKKNEWQRGLSVKALAQIGEPDAAADVRQLARKDQSAGVRAEAVDALPRPAGKKAVPDLIEALSDSSPSVRRDAAEGLGELRASEAILALVERLNDSEGWHHSAAYVSDYVKSALVEIGRPAVPDLLKAARSSDSSIRYDAAETLGRIGDRSARPQLRQLLKDPDRDVRRKAMEALQRVHRQRKPKKASLPVDVCWTSKH